MWPNRRSRDVPTVRRKRARKLEAEAEAAAAAAAAAAPTGRRAVSAPVASDAPAPGPGAPGPGASAPATTPASAVPTMPDRVDALTEAIGGELGRLRGEMRGRDADLVQALQQVAESYDRVAARLDDERRVQTLLAEALVRIDRRLATIEGQGIERQGIERQGIEGQGSAAPAVEAPADPAALEGPSTTAPAADGATTPSHDELTRPQRVIGGSIAPRQDIPRLDR